MGDLPVMLRVSGRRCVVVGGGPVACRRALSLRDAGAGVTVIAPDIDPALQDASIRLEKRPYRKGDLDGAFAVIIATNQREVNLAVARDAAQAGVLVNRADDPTAGDFTVPAHSHHGPITLAVHTSGISAAAGAAIRRELVHHLDPDWAPLLEIAGRYRAAIQKRFADPRERHHRLARLTGAEAMAVLRNHGPAALERYILGLMAPTPDHTETAQPPDAPAPSDGPQLPEHPAPRAVPETPRG
jgi:precorrin-2 dehydrogenase / sirohydrochlorin ferrochelatase